MVRTAFSMSKQTIWNEQDDAQFKKYNEMPLCEFLEFVARLIDLIFEDSEMEDLALDEKLELILEDLLPLVGH